MLLLQKHNLPSQQWSCDTDHRDRLKYGKRKTPSLTLPYLVQVTNLDWEWTVWIQLSLQPFRTTLRNESWFPFTKNYSNNISSSEVRTCNTIDYKTAFYCWLKSITVGLLLFFPRIFPLLSVYVLTKVCGYKVYKAYTHFQTPSCQK